MPIVVFFFQINLFFSLVLCYHYVLFKGKGRKNLNVSTPFACVLFIILKVCKVYCRHLVSGKLNVDYGTPYT